MNVNDDILQRDTHCKLLFSDSLQKLLYIFARCTGTFRKYVEIRTYNVKTLHVANTLKYEIITSSLYTRCK